MLNARALAITTGLLWGGMALVVGLANLVSPLYGVELLDLLASIYPGYAGAGGTVGDVIIGTIWGLVDGAVGGWLLAWLYNFFAA